MMCYMANASNATCDTYVELFPTTIVCRTQHLLSNNIFVQRMT